jgi:hypothetical protein
MEDVNPEVENATQQLVATVDGLLGDKNGMYYCICSCTAVHVIVCALYMSCTAHTTRHTAQSIFHATHIYCALHVIYCTLHIIHCTLHVIHCMLHVIHCTLHVIHCTLHVIHVRITNAKLLF